ncbi:MAG TPA: hypothetical protein VKE73_03490, partial [Myxococcota bacterium]|nr:hypothetical protein [Myxococcota bacterium]
RVPRLRRKEGRIGSPHPIQNVTFSSRQPPQRSLCVAVRRATLNQDAGDVAAGQKGEAPAEGRSI